MNVLLVKPYNLSDHIQPSLGLGYLATAIRDKGKVGILDCIKENININSFGDIIKTENPDVIGFQCYTFDLRFIKNALAVVKEIDTKIITVIGGPHPSALAEDTMQYFGNNLDYAFRGESERGFALFIDYLQGKSTALSDIPGFIWRKDSQIISNDCYFEQDLDSLGIVSWDMIRPETYPESQHGAFYRNFPIAPIMLTRGCPYPCVFCAGKLVSGRNLRKRSIPGVLSEIEILYKDYGIREFHIVDDNFTLDRDYAKEFLRKLIAMRLDISLATPNGVRLDTIDPELLALMKEGGLYLISLGIESGSDRILDLMQKKLTVKKIREAIDIIHHAGIEIAGFFILGFPGETREDIKKTIRFSLELGLVRANYFTYLPFPGTESYKNLILNKEIDKVDWEKFYFTTAPYVPHGFTRKQLRSLQRLAFIKFYLRPRIIFKNLCDIKSFKHFIFIFKRFLNWLVFN